MFGLLSDQGLGAMVYSPLAVGLLTGLYARGAAPPPNSPWGGGKPGSELDSAMSPKVMATVDSVRELARDRGKTMVQVAMNWVLSHPEITVAISGSDTIDQIDDNLGALGWQLSAEEIETLDQVSSGSDSAN